jgi:peptidyl-tRNA hydrolase, PTH1 family
MKLIVGLGNPGIEYQFTPHNMGFLVVDRIAQDLGVTVNNRRCQALTATGMIGGEKVVLAKPETFMNLSGASVVELIERTTDSSFDMAQDLIVVYDELDLPLGRLQVRERGGAAGHNGIKSILGALGIENWVRVRVGIAPEHKPANAAKYVLAPFRKADLPVIDEAIERAAEAVRSIVTDGVATAMNRFNRRPDEKTEGAKPTA